MVITANVTPQQPNFLLKPQSCDQHVSIKEFFYNLSAHDASTLEADEVLTGLVYPAAAQVVKLGLLYAFIWLSIYAAVGLSFGSQPTLPSDRWYTRI